jgi:hypothetical protein
MLKIETEKAVQVTAQVYLEIAPKGGFTSSLIRDKVFQTNIWFPKSQIKDGMPSGWIISQKLREFEQQAELRDCQVLNSSISIYLEDGTLYNMTEVVEDYKSEQTVIQSSSDDVVKTETAEIAENQNVKFSALKNARKNLIAVCSATTTYLTNATTGEIYKQFTGTYLDSNFSEKVEVPATFAAKKVVFDFKEKNKSTIKKLDACIERISKSMERRDFLISLWKWRRGEIEAYRVCTYDDYAAHTEYSTTINDEFGDLIFGEQPAFEVFKKTIGSWDPEIDGEMNSVIGVVELYQYEIDLDDRLNYLSEDDFSTNMYDFEKPVEMEVFGKKIPDDAIIARLDRYGNPTSIYRGSSFEDYSEISSYEKVFDSIFELFERYREDVVDLLKDEFSEEELRDAIYPSDYEWFFEEEEEEEEEEDVIAEMLTFKINENVVIATGEQINDIADTQYNSDNKQNLLWIYESNVTKKGKSWMPVVEVFSEKNDAHTHKIADYYCTLPLTEQRDDYQLESWIRKHCEITRLQEP